MPFRSILVDHARRYPAWELDDLYKLIHQAAMGSEHALADEARAREWLNRELATLGPSPAEPLIDPISPDGRIVRVHLRPFRRLRLPPENLLQAFLETAQQVAPSNERFSELAAAASQASQQGLLAFTAAQVDAYMAQRQDSGHPPVHHSPRYVQLYRPAYRVVARDLLTDGVLLAE